MLKKQLPFYIQAILFLIVLTITPVILSFKNSRIKTIDPEVPEQNRFEIEVLDTYMYEPMEMVIFKDGRVLFVERRGEIKLYSPVSKKTKVIATLDVSIKGNYEDGILGVALDPDYEQNHWIYINYSPAGNIPKQNVSRFEMVGDSLNLKSEKIVLEIPTQRETCCHSGGHLEFGPNKDLYISTGDNTSSKESDGFSPIDERPGRAPFDAQKSSGNTNDLRGKILRIHPEKDGTYTIPKGNLFPEGMKKTRPEIYIMGARNPFRFTVDKKTGNVYWGDVGPDGGVDTERGPQSYDEFNQARKAGNYGWPYFVADNKAYADFDFATNKIGKKFNPEKPENLSPNNTGAKILPPAQEAMIYYPYGESKEFPSLGKGSRSAMAGPFYYAEDYPEESRFPEYYNGKLFIYEWARSWIKTLSFKENQDLDKIEDFLPDQEWHKPIDMKFGPDGSLYVLEYGANYFEHNQDSRLIKIKYIRGNRKPIAKLTADKTIGAAPLTVKLSAEESLDNDKNTKLSYNWETGVSNSSSGSTTTVTYTKPGIYRPKVTVVDNEGEKSTAELEIKVGNEMPVVRINLASSNRSFYFDEKLNYKVEVSDKEDGTLGKGIDPSSVFVSFDYLKEGKDLALLNSNAVKGSDVKFLKGKNLIGTSDCKSCHDMNKQSIGPSYMAIAARYKDKSELDMLSGKILKGGNGNWGKNMMAPHPQHTKTEADEMVKYILSLTEKQNTSLPLQGALDLKEHRASKTIGLYILRANYDDKGAEGAPPLSKTETLTLRNPHVEAEDFDLSHNNNIRHLDGTDMTFVGNAQANSYVGLKNVDLTGINQLVFNADSRHHGSLIEIRIDQPDGKILGTIEIPKGEKNNYMKQVIAEIASPIDGIHNFYVLFKNAPGIKEEVLDLDWVRFEKRKDGVKQ